MSSPDMAELAFKKQQLIGSLGAVAVAMRDCATIADQFVLMLGGTPGAPHGAPLVLNTDGLQNASSPAASTPVAPKGRKRKGEDVEPPTDGKKRRVRKPRDPNAPKRPPSSYIYYQNEIRAALKNKYPDITHSELLTRISQQWGKMTPEEKDSYEQKQAAAKAKYEAEKLVYDASLAKAAADEAAADEAAASSPALSPAVFPATKTLPADADSSEENSSTSSEAEDEEGAEAASSSSEDVVRELAKPAVLDTPAPKPAKAKKAAPAPVAVTPATKEKEKHPKEKKSAKKAKA